MVTSWISRISAGNAAIGGRMRALDPDYLPRTGLWEGVLLDLTSRGALAGALAAIYAIATLGWWTLHIRSIRRRSERIPIRILVTGTRGKSSVVRLLHAALSNAGLRVEAKTTGTAARNIEPNGCEHPTRRLGQVSIVETVSTMAHSTRRHVDAVVVECMAVNPNLIRQLSADIVRPTIVGVTNSDLDHLEEEGSDRLAIMASLAQAVTSDQVVVTAEEDPLCVWELQQRTQEMGGQLISVDRRMSVDRDDHPLVPGAHPANVALVLGSTRACAIPDAVAIDGMRKASHEPEEEEVLDGELEGTPVRWCNLGSINDANNVLPAVDRLLGPRSPDRPRVALLSGRSDRPLRALLFSGLLPPTDFDAVIVTGGPEAMVVSGLESSGWATPRILRLGALAYSRRLSTRLIVRFVKRLYPRANAFELVALENIHVPFTSSLRRTFLRPASRRTGAGSAS